MNIFAGDLPPELVTERILARKDESVERGPPFYVPHQWFISSLIPTKDFPVAKSLQPLPEQIDEPTVKAWPVAPFLVHGSPFLRPKEQIHRSLPLPPESLLHIPVQPCG